MDGDSGVQLSQAQDGRDAEASILIFAFPPDSSEIIVGWYKLPSKCACDSRFRALLVKHVQRLTKAQMQHIKELR